MAKRQKSSRRNPTQHARRRKPSPAVQETHSSTDGVAAQLIGAQRKLWQAGANALVRSSKIAGPMSPVAFAESLQGGIRKLEEVFDHRVLNALSNAGMPSPQEIRALMERVDSLSAEVQRLSRKRSKK